MVQSKESTFNSLFLCMFSLKLPLDSVGMCIGLQAKTI